MLVQVLCAACGKWRAKSKFSRCATCWDCRKQATVQVSIPSPPPPRRGRKRKPYEQLGPTQRWARRKEAAAALSEIQCPAEVLCTPKSSPEHVLALSTAERRTIRKSTPIKLPGEQRMAALKQLLAAQQGTETATALLPAWRDLPARWVAYVTDPLRLLNCVRAHSKWISVGGDAGGGFTKLGVTYPLHGVQHFIPLLVVEGKDSYDCLSQLAQPNITTFCGNSERHTHIFSILQTLIDAHPLTFLNGDMPFISAMIGHMGQSATFPCPICIVGKQHLLATPRDRRPTDTHSMLPTQPPLIRIASNRIVPTPLHLFLGLSNRIIEKAYKEILEEATRLKLISDVKTVHSAGHGGVYDVHRLTGPELSKFVKNHPQAEQLIMDPYEYSRESEAKVLRLKTLWYWMSQLHDHLLPKDVWKPATLASFREAVDDIQSNWIDLVGQRPFPQLHMLSHAITFAERYRFLGAVSEAQIESFHYKFNDIYHNHHLNKTREPGERLRRSLADAVLNERSAWTRAGLPEAIEATSPRPTRSTARAA